MFDENTIDRNKIKDGDELIIPETNNVVYVYGETSTQGAVMFSENKNVEYFIDKSGGFKKFADRELYMFFIQMESHNYTNQKKYF